MGSAEVEDEGFVFRVIPSEDWEGWGGRESMYLV